MPKYAVAVGRKIGIYNTYPECLEQVKNFPNAKFKKFDSVEDAEKFIEQYLKPRKANVNSTNDGSTSCSITALLPENAFRPQTFSVDKISPTNSVVNALNKKVISLEEKLNKYILNTNEVIESLKNKIQNLERKRPLTEEEVPVPESTKKIRIDPEIDECNLNKNTEGFVIAYTDGACTNNGKNGARAGIGVWFGDDHPLNVSAPVKGPPTNNNAEIQAAYVAIKQARKANISKLSIHTDSQFLINCITQWIHRWKKNDWQLASGGPVKNKDQLVKLDNAIQKMDVVEWNYVRGHKGVIGNEMADRLARKGAEQYKQNLTYSVQVSSDDD